MIEFFLNAYKDVPLSQIALEFVAFVFGILSVWYAKKENIWVYPTGLIATIITTYLYSWIFGVSKKQISQANQLSKIEPLQIQIQHLKTEKISIELDIESK